MEIMIIGLLLWSLVHFIPSLTPSIKISLQKKMGEAGYKIAFALSMVISLVLIVFGWRDSVPSHIYSLDFPTKHLTMGLMVFAFVLFGAAQYPSRIKTFIRHPQLMGLVVWSVAHLLSNGDSRSVVLFTTLGIWALLEMIFINRRDGIRDKPEIPSWGRELRGLAISLVIFVVIIFAHPYIAGVSLR
jgi:uncharacterized membrane protein